MKHEQTSVLIFGYDKGLQETRQWVLQTRGYHVTIALDRDALADLPGTRGVDLLLVCHSVPRAERESAIAFARSRWPGCRHLTLTPDQGRIPTGLLGQLLHTMDGPARLIALVGSALREPEAHARAS